MPHALIHALNSAILSEDRDQQQDSLNAIYTTPDAFVELKSLITTCSAFSPLQHLFEHAGRGYPCADEADETTEICGLLFELSETLFDTSPYIEYLLFQHEKCLLPLLTLTIHYCHPQEKYHLANYIDSIIAVAVAVTQERIENAAQQIEKKQRILTELHELLSELITQFCTQDASDSIAISLPQLTELINLLAANSVIQTLDSTSVAQRQSHAYITQFIIFNNANIASLQRAANQKVLSSTLPSQLIRLARHYLTNIPPLMLHHKYALINHIVENIISQGGNNPDTLWEELTRPEKFIHALKVQLMHVCLCSTDTVMQTQQLYNLINFIPARTLNTSIEDSIKLLCQLNDVMQVNPSHPGHRLKRILQQADSHNQKSNTLQRILSDIFDNLVLNTPSCDAKLTSLVCQAEKITDPVNLSDNAARIIRYTQQIWDATLMSTSSTEITQFFSHYTNPQLQINNLITVNQRLSKAAINITMISFKKREWDALSRAVKQFYFLMQSGFIPTTTDAATFLALCQQTTILSSNSLPFAIQKQLCECLLTLFAAANVTDTQQLNAAYTHAMQIQRLSSEPLRLNRHIRSHFSALALACLYHNTELATQLITLGADIDGMVETIDQRDSVGLRPSPHQTPLMLAVKKGNSALVNTLIHHGANITYYCDQMNSRATVLMVLLLQVTNLRNNITDPLMREIATVPYCQILRKIIRKAKTFHYPVLSELFSQTRYPQHRFTSTILSIAVESSSTDLLNTLYLNGLDLTPFTDYCLSNTDHLFQYSPRAISIFFNLYVNTLSLRQFAELRKRVLSLWYEAFASGHMNPTLNTIRTILARTHEIPIIIHQYHQGIGRSTAVESIIDCVARGADPAMLIDGQALPYHLMSITTSISQLKRYFVYCEPSKLPLNNKAEDVLTAAVTNQFASSVIALLPAETEYQHRSPPFFLSQADLNLIMSRASQIVSSLLERPDSDEKKRKLNDATMIYLKLVAYFTPYFFEHLQRSLLPHWDHNQVKKADPTLSIADLHQLHQRCHEPLMLTQPHHQRAMLFLGLSLCLSELIEPNWVLLVGTQLRRENTHTPFTHPLDRDPRAININSVCHHFQIPLLLPQEQADRHKQANHSLQHITRLYHAVIQRGAYSPIINIMHYLTLQEATRLLRCTQSTSADLLGLFRTATSECARQRSAKQLSP